MADKINNTLDRLMKKYIRQTGHNESGALSRSIRFNATYYNGNFDLGLKANDYILYLDNGRFIDNFLSLTPVKVVIADFIAESLLEDL